MARQGSATDPPKVNIIDSDASLEGTLAASSDIRISGMVNGLVRGSAAVVISSGGSVLGDVHAKHATIAGKIKGNIVVEELLLLLGAAEIEGTITAARLVIEEGAVFNGECHMDGGPKPDEDVVITASLARKGPAPAAAR